MSQSAMTPEQLALMVDLLPVAASLRDIAAMVGANISTLRVAAQPFIAVMKLAGTLPKCSCGRDRFHMYGCKAVYARGDYADLVVGRSREESARLLAQRQAILDAIMRGERYSEIERRLGISHKSARKYLRFLTPEQIARRKKLETDRPLRYRPVTQTLPFNDALYSRIAKAVPRWPSPALRDDIISDVYLAVTSGELAADEVEAQASRYAKRAANDFESRFGPISLDQPVSSSDDRTLIETIADAGSTDGFDQIEAMEIGRTVRSPHRRRQDGDQSRWADAA
jgi:hypothetical protein